MPTKHIHHKANSIWSGHAATSPDYLRAVAVSVSDAGAVLITGPANAKTELVEYIRLHDPKLALARAGVPTTYGDFEHERCRSAALDLCIIQPGSIKTEWVSVFERRIGCAKISKQGDITDQLSSRLMTITEI